jgi:hypothetical protein
LAQWGSTLLLPCSNWVDAVFVTSLLDVVTREYAIFKCRNQRATSVARLGLWYQVRFFGGFPDIKGGSKIEDNWPTYEMDINTRQCSRTSRHKQPTGLQWAIINEPNLSSQELPRQIPLFFQHLSTMLYTTPLIFALVSALPSLSVDKRATGQGIVQFTPDGNIDISAAGVDVIAGGSANTKITGRSSNPGVTQATPGGEIEVSVDGINVGAAVPSNTKVTKRDGISLGTSGFVAGSTSGSDVIPNINLRTGVSPGIGVTLPSKRGSGVGLGGTGFGGASVDGGPLPVGASVGVGSSGGPVVSIGQNGISFGGSDSISTGGTIAVGNSSDGGITLTFGAGGSRGGHA